MVIVEGGCAVVNEVEETAEASSGEGEILSIIGEGVRILAGIWQPATSVIPRHIKRKIRMRKYTLNHATVFSQPGNRTGPRSYPMVINTGSGSWMVAV